MTNGLGSDAGGRGSTGRDRLTAGSRIKCHGIQRFARNCAATLCAVAVATSAAVGYPAAADPDPGGGVSSEEFYSWCVDVDMQQVNAQTGHPGPATVAQKANCCKRSNGMWSYTPDYGDVICRWYKATAPPNLGPTTKPAPSVAPVSPPPARA